MKKHLWLIIGAVVAVAAIVVSLVFVFTPDENEPEVFFLYCVYGGSCSLERIFADDVQAV